MNNCLCCGRLQICYKMFEKNSIFIKSNINNIIDSATTFSFSMKCLFVNCEFYKDAKLLLLVFMFVSFYLHLVASYSI